MFVRSNNTNKWDAQEQDFLQKLIKDRSNNTNKWDAQEHLSLFYHIMCLIYRTSAYFMSLNFSKKVVFLSLNWFKNRIFFSVCWLILLRI